MAGHYDFTIEQGATFSRVITWSDASNTPVNITGYTAKLEIATATRTQILVLTETNGLTLGGSAGTITINLTAAQTAAMTFDTAQYELELTSGTGSVKRLLRGIITLDGEAL